MTAKASLPSRPPSELGRLVVWPLAKAPLLVLSFVWRKNEASVAALRTYMNHCACVGCSAPLGKQFPAQTLPVPRPAIPGCRTLDVKNGYFFWPRILNFTSDFSFVFTFDI